MCTFEDPDGSAAGIDLGAQYISATPQAYLQHQRLSTLA